MEDLKTTLKEIQDFLSPSLDGWEQMLYHYLFRHSHLEGRDVVTVGARSLAETIGSGRKGADKLARNTIPRKLRTLAHKGCIEILSKSHEGTTVRVLLPRQIPGLIKETVLESINIEQMDFYIDRNNRILLFERDKKCIYCHKPLTAKTFTIDHIMAQEKNGSNSYRNLICSCFECNSKKTNRTVDEFLILQYRNGLLTQDDFKESKDYINAVKDGKLPPKI